MAIKTVQELKDTYPELTEQIEKAAIGEDQESSISITKDKNGDILEWVEELRDFEDILISKRIDKYCYYSTGKVDVIIQQVFDKDNKLVKEAQVKHYKDKNKIDVIKTK